MTNFDKATILIIKIALFMAFIDDEFHDSEAKIIKKWINQRAKGKVKTKAKDAGYKFIERSVSYDTAFRDSTKLVKSGKLNVEDLCSKLCSINSEPGGIEALELAVQIMIADNEIRPSEVKLIHQLAGLLDIPWNEIMKITDRTILGMSKVPNKIDIEGLLKIDPTVSNKNADKRFQKEINKWNAATTSVETDLGRKIAQKMYDLFSDANDKYA